MSCHKLQRASVSLHRIQPLSMLLVPLVDAISEIKPPGNQQHGDYISYKLFPSIKMQTICDARGISKIPCCFYWISRLRTWSQGFAQQPHLLPVTVSTSWLFPPWRRWLSLPGETSCHPYTIQGLSARHRYRKGSIGIIPVLVLSLNEV